MSRKPIPQEIDELIWAAAESNSDHLRQDFERRYPEYRPELATRIAMVEVLKKSKPTSEALPFVHPAEVQKPSPMRRLVLIPIAAVSLAFLAFAAYKVTLSQVGETSSPVSTNRLTKESNIPEPNAMTATPDPEIPPEPSGSTGTAAETGRLPSSPTQKQVQIPAEGNLISILDSVGRQAGVKITLMTGVKDEVIILVQGQKDAILSLPLNDALLAIERVANVRFVDNGPDGVLVLPLEKVRNLDPGEAPTLPVTDKNN